MKKLFILSLTIATCSLQAMRTQKSNDLNAQLCLAACNGKVEYAKKLLEKGADINAKDTYGTTPLHYAVATRYELMVQFLIDKKACIDAQDKFGRTPLHWSCIYKIPSITFLLLKNGANTAISDKKGKGFFEYTLASFQHKPLEAKAVLSATQSILPFSKQTMQTQALPAQEDQPAPLPKTSPKTSLSTNRKHLAIDPEPLVRNYDFFIAEAEDGTVKINQHKDTIPFDSLQKRPRRNERVE